MILWCAWKQDDDYFTYTVNDISCELEKSSTVKFEIRKILFFPNETNSETQNLLVILLKQ